MTKWLALLTSNHEIPAFISSGSDSGYDFMTLHCTELIIITFPSSRYDY